MSDHAALSASAALAFNTPESAPPRSSGPTATDGADGFVRGPPPAILGRGVRISIVHLKLCTQPQANKEAPRAHIGTGGDGSAHNRAVGMGGGAVRAAL